MKSMSESRGQQGFYRTLVDAAYAAEAERLKGELPTKENWRREVNLATTGKYSTKEMNQTTDFDAVMLELAIIAGNDKWITRLSAAAERRLRYVIRQFIPDLEFLEKQPIRWAYIQGICNQMNIPDRLDDCPASLLQKVLQALDTHIRRLAKKADIELLDLPSGYFRRGVRQPAATAKYRHDHHHHINHGAAA